MATTYSKTQQDEELESIKEELERSKERFVTFTAELVRTNEELLVRIKEALARIEDEHRNRQEIKATNGRHLQNANEDLDKADGSLVQQLSKLAHQVELQSSYLREHVRNHGEKLDEANKSIGGLKSYVQRHVADNNKLADTIKKLGQEYDAIIKDVDELQVRISKEQVDE